MGKINYLRVSAVKKLVKENGRRSGKYFLEELDRMVGEIVYLCSKKESKKKTLDAFVIGTVTCFIKYENGKHNLIIGRKSRSRNEDNIGIW